MRGKLMIFSLVLGFLIAIVAVGIETAEAEPNSQFVPGIGSPIQVWDDAGNNTNPTVAYNSLRDEYLVVWATMQDQFSTDIWGRRLRGDGSPIPNGWFNIDNFAGLHLISPAVAYNSQTDQYLVVYTADIAMDDHDIWGKVVEWNGVLSNRLYIDTGFQRQTDPDVVYNHIENHYLIAYSDYQSFSTVNLKLQTLNQAGGMINSYSIVSATGQYRGNPDLAFSAIDNRYLVVYGHEGSFIPRILGKSFSTTLGSLTPEFHYTDDGSGGMNPKIACSSHDCLVTWNGLMGAGIKARQSALDGSSLGPSGGFEIAAPVLGVNQEASSISLFKPWGYIITWDHFLTTSADKGDVYGSIVGFWEYYPTGSGFPMDNRAYYEGFSDLACDPTGSCLLVNDHNPVQYPAGDKEISGHLVFSPRNFIPLIMR